MISGSPAATRMPAVHPLATGLGTGVAVRVGSGVRGSGVEGTDGGAEATTEGDGETDGEAQPVTARRTAKKTEPGRNEPAGTGLVGVVLEPAHGGQGGIAQELGLALQQCQFGAETGGRVGRLEESLFA